LCEAACICGGDVTYCGCISDFFIFEMKNWYRYGCISFVRKCSNRVYH
jgi:hypothetical protein